jgi:hypothetical protein
MSPGASGDGLVARDLRHVWHPCSQMKDYETFPPVEVVSAEGTLLHLKDGSTLIRSPSRSENLVGTPLEPTAVRAVRIERSYKESSMSNARLTGGCLCGAGAQQHAKQPRFDRS